MHTWIAERYVDSDDVWRDQDVAMSSDSHTFMSTDPEESKADARKMLIGMLMAEFFGFEDLRMAVKSAEHLKAAQEVFNGAELVRIGQHVVFRIRRKDRPLFSVA